MDASELLAARYPALSFLLSLDPSKPAFAKDPILDLSSLNLETLELIYVEGIGTGKVYDALKGWLAKDKRRDLVFLEMRGSALKAFLKERVAAEILAHPQVHLRFNLEPQRLEKFLEECFTTFPNDQIAVIPGIKGNTPDFKRLELILRRLTTVHHALALENQHVDHFFPNLIKNFRRLDHAFDGNALRGTCKGVPAIICGAGPSLNRDIEALKSLKEQALIIAGGSAIAALSQQGLTPHFGVALDPNEEEVRRFEQNGSVEMPLLGTARLHTEVFNTLSGPFGYLQTGAAGALERFFEEKMELSSQPLDEGLSQEALSVTTTAVEFAKTLGCNPIIFVGVDLAYTDGKSYAKGITPSKEPSSFGAADHILTRKDIHGNSIRTQVKWVMESSAIGAFAKCHPTTQFLNASSGGIGFPSIPNRPLTSLELPLQRDLEGKVHHLIQTHPLPVTSTHIETFLQDLKTSLMEGEKLIAVALKELEKVRGKAPETGLLTLCQMDFEALPSFRPCFEEPFRILPLQVARALRPRPWEGPDPTYAWHLAHAKWSTASHLTTHYLRTLDASLPQTLQKEGDGV
ncbi:MAG: motility associated factor glycosyltransferase family protein [Chlamydiia bacterium]|nr:motility associated factor glycosyltransferase family protein [Chlamydiia bacterium]